MQWALGGPGEGFTLGSKALARDVMVVQQRPCIARRVCFHGVGLLELDSIGVLDSSVEALARVDLADV